VQHESTDPSQRHFARTHGASRSASCIPVPVPPRAQSTPGPRRSRTPCRTASPTPGRSTPPCSAARGPSRCAGRTNSSAVLASKAGELWHFSHELCIVVLEEIGSVETPHRKTLFEYLVEVKDWGWSFGIVSADSPAGHDETPASHVRQRSTQVGPAVMSQYISRGPCSAKTAPTSAPIDFMYSSFCCEPADAMILSSGCFSLMKCQQILLRH